jgi:hypothetical protein
MSRITYVENDLKFQHKTSVENDLIDTTVPQRTRQSPTLDSGVQQISRWDIDLLGASVG